MRCRILNLNGMTPREYQHFIIEKKEFLKESVPYYPNNDSIVEKMRGLGARFQSGIGEFPIEDSIIIKSSKFSGLF